jgi:peptide deformylase
MIRKILTVPNPLLRQKSKKVAKVDKKIQKVITDLLETVKNASEPTGLGLSAVQIGQPMRIFVAKTKNNFEVFINPQIVFASKETLKKVLKKEQRFFEGCLSVPQVYGFVDRPYQIKLEWLDEKGRKHSRQFTNRNSVCLQHEFDHLEGILFIDRILQQKGKVYQLEKDSKGKEVFEEVELL